MSVRELEAEVARLSPDDMKAFSQWFEEFRADAWDRQLETDMAAGKLNAMAARADEDFDAGRCTPL